MCGRPITYKPRAIIAFSSVGICGWRVALYMCCSFEEGYIERAKGLLLRAYDLTAARE